MVETTTRRQTSNYSQSRRRQKRRERLFGQKEAQICCYYQLNVRPEPRWLVKTHQRNSRVPTRQTQRNASVFKCGGEKMSWLSHRKVEDRRQNKETLFSLQESVCSARSIRAQRRERLHQLLLCLARPPSQASPAPASPPSPVRLASPPSPATPTPASPAPASPPSPPSVLLGDASRNDA